MIFGEECRALSFSLCSLLLSPVTSSLLGPKILLSTLSSESLSLHSSLIYVFILTRINFTFQHPSHHDDNRNKGDYLEGIIRFPDFLKQHGTYQEFWTRPWVIKALKAVNDREMTLRKCSELLGVGYNILYSQYRQLHGCLKAGSSEAPGTSSDDLKIITSPLTNKQEGRIVLRGNELSVAAAF
jgi:hypothetical protein